MKALILCGEGGYRSFKKGEYPEHLLYGSSELERMGYKLAFLPQDKDKGNILKILACLFKEKPEIILIPYVLNKHMLLALFKQVFFRKTKLFGWIHKDLIPRSSGKVLSLILKVYVSKFINYFDKIFCLSKTTLLEETVAFNAKNLEFIPWAGDFNYYKQFYTAKDKSYCISTGKENRQIDLLIRAVNDSDGYAKIYINDDSFKDRGSSNILLNTGWFELDRLLVEVANSSFVVIPINEKKINYCVGLSSVTEAMCLGKPIIATYNPYWHIDIEKENIGIYIRNNTKEEWVDAINLLSSNKELCVEMGRNARRLAEEQYNFSIALQMMRDIIASN